MAIAWAMIINLDNILLNSYWRKFYTYQKLGWDDESIQEYLSKKKNSMQVASFNTNSVSFAASSRRNRFYEIYNQDEMLDQDVAWPGAIEAIDKISKKYKVHVISARGEPMQAKTLEVMARLGFSQGKLTIFFKRPHEKLYLYRKRIMESILPDYPGGVGVCLNPSDRSLFDRYNYVPIAFTSIKNHEEFQNATPPFPVVCSTWDEITRSLKCG